MSLSLFTECLFTLQATNFVQDTFPKTKVNGVTSAEWETIRITQNHYSNGPVTDVGSDLMTCYERDPGVGAPKTVNVQAGGTVSFLVNGNVGHPGPLHFYMAKVPAGKTAATFDGKGAVWFKVYQDGPSGLGTGSIKWPSDGKLAFQPPSPADP